MNHNNWNADIKTNFDNAAHSYSKYSFIQKYFAQKIIILLKNLLILENECFDLGSGTGYLADQIEKEFKGISVTRVDFSPNMLLENKKNSKTILWDLNNLLPKNINNCSLIVSSFCLHWLTRPEKVINHWHKKLSIGGFLIVLFPTNKSFPEWKETCFKNNFEYGGLNFPCPNKIESIFKNNEIHSINQYQYKETFPNIYKLFKSIVLIGAQTTNSQRKTVKELRMMQKTWPKDHNKNVTLTWDICILILKNDNF